MVLALASYRITGFQPLLAGFQPRLADIFAYVRTYVGKAGYQPIYAEFLPIRMPLLAESEIPDH